MRDGFQLVPGVFSSDDVERLRGIVESAAAESTRLRRAGTRGLLAVSGIRDLAASTKLAALVEAVLGPGAFAVRGIYFDKTAEANWKLPFHQDLMIPVARVVTGIVGWGACSVKEGVPHVEPPISVLESMLSVRIHLDDTGAENGALRVIAGSHSHGRLTPAEIARLRAATSETVCVARAGDVMLMRPLVLHASSAAALPKHRRVIHLDYTSARPLPDGVSWWPDAFACRR